MRLGIIAFHYRRSHRRNFQFTSRINLTVAAVGERLAPLLAHWHRILKFCVVIRYLLFHVLFLECKTTHAVRVKLSADDN